MSSAYKKPDIETNHSNFPTILYILAALIIYGWGIVGSLLFLTDAKNQPVINELMLKLGISIGLLPFLGIFLILYIPIMLVFGYLLLKLIAWLAQEVTMVVSILFPFVIIGAGVLLITLSPESFIMGIILAGFGGILLLIVIIKFQSLRRAGKFVEFSAQFVLDEKAVLWPPIFLGIFTLFSGFFLLFGFAEINSLFMQQTPNGDELHPVGVVLSFIYSYCYLIVYFGLYYVLNAGVVSYALDWYRELDPDQHSARKDVRQVLPVIFSFAIISTTIKVIMSAASSVARDSTQSSSRGRGGSGGAAAGMMFAMILSVFISILGAIWQFINYFTLVSIVENKQGLKDSIKDSAKTRWNSYLDVLVGDTGFGLTMFIFFIINSLIWFIGGMALTFTLLGGGELLGISWTLVGIVMGIIFVILGFYPYNLVTSPMRIAFTSFLYAYAKDSIEGFQKPSRIPVEFTDEFKLLQKDRDRKRKMRDPTQYF